MNVAESLGSDDTERFTDTFTPVRGGAHAKIGVKGKENSSRFILKRLCFNPAGTKKKERRTVR